VLINILNKQKLLKIDSDEVAYCVKKVLEEENIKTDEIFIHLVSKAKIKKLHKDFYKLISEPAESEAISSKERDEYSDSKYYVITVVPLVDGPHLNKYIFNQEELDQFLDGYNEFAEFLVEIKKIKSSS